MVAEAHGSRGCRLNDSLKGWQETESQAINTKRSQKGEFILSKELDIFKRVRHDEY